MFPPPQPSRVLLEALKADCLSTGIRVTAPALEALGGVANVTLHEYATTGGICFELDEQIFLNAAFDDWYCDEAEAVLDINDDGTTFVVHRGREFPVRQVIPLPGYIGTVDAAGRRVDAVAMSHLDRVRLSPLLGCAYDCQFCDLPAERYQRRELEHLVSALEVAATDTQLPVRHVLISGGTPGRRDYGWFDDVCVGLLTRAQELGMEVDVMMSAREDGIEVVDRLISAGVTGFSFNIELAGAAASNLFISQKHRFSRPHFESMVRHAVERLGSGGRVRSLIIPGLEPISDTINGIEFLASLGCDPVISPFRPARRTKLEHHIPIGASALTGLLDTARRIVADHGVALGPACIPCQHNTLTFPWDTRPSDQAAATAAAGR